MPIRTCAGCRSRRPQLELLRFALQTGRLLADPTGSRPGRGVYCCPRLDCLSRAAQKGGFARSLRRPAPVDFAALLAQVREALTQASDQLRMQMTADGRARTGERPEHDAPGPGSERLARWTSWYRALGETKDRAWRSE